MCPMSCASTDLTASAHRYPQAVVVNLPKHEARFEGVKQQLDEAGVKFERIGAVVGKQLSPEERRSNVTALARVLITPGMMVMTVVGIKLLGPTPTRSSPL